MPLELKTLKIKDIEPYKNNPRLNDEAVEPLMNSIKEFGFKVPIVVDKDNVVVAGHTRLKAAKRLGLKEVPCIVADDLTDEQVNAFRLADNKVSELADWDINLLDLELEEINDIDMELFGFEPIIDDEEIEEPDVEEDEVPEAPEQPKARRGDIYQLGRHRLMCGDSTSEHDVKTLSGGVLADLVFTDPPYGMKKEKDGVTNDNLSYADLLEFNKKWIPLTFDNLKENGSWYCWGIDEPLMDIYSNILKPMIARNEITFRNLITWDKGSGQGQMYEKTRMYAPADEKCLFVMCGVMGFNTNSENYYEGWEAIRGYLDSEREKAGLKLSDINNICGTSHMASHWFTKSQWVMLSKENYEKIQEYCRTAGAFSKPYEVFKKEYDEINKEYEKIKQDFYLNKRAYFDNVHDNMNSVWHFNRLTHGTEELKSAGGHATPKPIILCSRAIKSSTRENETVLDVFGGSGSTLIACEQLNRTCLMMEFEPKWIDVIINRWENLTGEKAVLISRVEE